MSNEDGWTNRRKGRSVGVKLCRTLAAGGGPGTHTLPPPQGDEQQSLAESHGEMGDVRDHLRDGPRGERKSKRTWNVLCDSFTELLCYGDVTAFWLGTVVGPSPPLLTARFFQHNSLRVSHGPGFPHVRAGRWSHALCLTRRDRKMYARFKKGKQTIRVVILHIHRQQKVHTSHG